jgi:hypothetical protein
VPACGTSTAPKWLYVKGALFLLTGLFASVLLLVESPTLLTAFLLIVAVWSFCRLYYFAFYVIEHSVDPRYKFAGLTDFVRYVWRGRRAPGPPDGRLPQADAESAQRGSSS